MTVANQTAANAEVDAKIKQVIDNLSSINAELGEAEPQRIIEWAIDNLPGLYQTTAFGLTGCITVDMISKISKARGSDKHLVPLIFVDTLYHFPQTLTLAHKLADHYAAPMHIYYPPGTETASAFEKKWGESLWEKDEDLYDYLVKVEPARRAYEQLGVRAVFTGRRRSQGADRASLPAVEVDETGLIKVNALMNWSFAQVDEYAKANSVPYNELLDLGFKSVGDWHSTAAPGADGGERSGRWKDKGGKTECGLHKDYFEMKAAAEKKLKEAEAAAACASASASACS